MTKTHFAIRRGTYFAATLLTATVTAVGCAPTRVYTVQQDWQVTQEFFAATSTSEPNTTGREVLNRATTIAFRPPDACSEVKAAGAGAAEQDNMLRLQCGVLISELEAEATRAGFEVVSWQVLKEGITIDRARANKVDILFEINELSLDFPPQKIYSASATNFFDNGSPRVVSNAVDVARRCENRFLPSLPAIDAVTMDLKMVAVDSGRVGWYYRIVDAGEAIPALSRSEKYTVQPQAGVFDDMDSTVLGLGLGSFIAGGVLYLVGPLAGEPLLTQMGLITAGLGAIATVLGVGMMVINNATATYADPASIICMQQADGTPLPPQATPAAAASVTLQNSSNAFHNSKDQTRRALLKNVVRNFMSKVKSYRGAMPAPAPVAPIIAPAASSTPSQTPVQ